MSDALKLARMRDDDEAELSPLCRSIIDGTHQAVKPRQSHDADIISELVDSHRQVGNSAQEAGEKINGEQT